MAYKSKCGARTKTRKNQLWRLLFHKTSNWKFPSPVRVNYTTVCTLPQSSGVTGWRWESLTRPGSWEAQISMQKAATGGVRTEEQKKGDKCPSQQSTPKREDFGEFSHGWFLAMKANNMWKPSWRLLLFEGHLTLSVCTYFTRLHSSNDLTRPHWLSSWRTSVVEEQKGGRKSH